jgi:hypothetical protein
MLRRNIKREPNISFHAKHSYYGFIDVFNKRRLLFLLNLVARIISSILTWLKDCNFLESIFKEHKLRVRIFKILNI